MSILIPVYNVGQYIAQCLESVIYQTYRNLEIIIVDDGSTDDSGIICDRYAGRDDRIQVFHTSNKGLAAARNLGLDHAKGPYISFIDSDDWIEQHTIETLLKIAAETDADIVTARSCSEYKEKTVYPKTEKEEVKVFCGKDILPAYVKGAFREVAWNKLYKQDCFSGIRYPEGHNFEDVSTTWKIMKRTAEKKGTIAACPEVLFHFRVRKSSISHTMSLNNVVDCWNAYQERFEGLEGFQERPLAKCMLSVGRMWISYSLFGEKEKKKAERTIREMMAFAKAYRHQVLTGDYSLRLKLICIAALSKSPLVMRGAYFANKMWKQWENRGREMFE